MGHDRVVDPFGDTIGERVWRRLAGSGLAVIVCAAVFALWSVELLPWVTFGGAVVYLLGVPASWAVGRRGGSAVRRHIAAGAAVGAVVAVALALLSDGVGLWYVFGVFSVGFGVLVAGAAAWGGLALPSRWVRPVAVAGVLTAAVVLPVGSWLAHRPPAPHDFVVMNATIEAQQQFGDAHGLARAVADGFEQRSAEGRPRTAHETWVAVGESISDRDLGDSEAWLRFTPDEELPTLRSSDEPVRLVTTMLRGEQARACVVVSAAWSRVEPRACADLELTR